MWETNSSARPNPSQSSQQKPYRLEQTKWNLPPVLAGRSSQQHPSGTKRSCSAETERKPNRHLACKTTEDWHIATVALFQLCFLDLMKTHQESAFWLLCHFVHHFTTPSQKRKKNYATYLNCPFSLRISYIVFSAGFNRVFVRWRAPLLPSLLPLIRQEFSMHAACHNNSQVKSKPIKHYTNS